MLLIFLFILFLIPTNHFPSFQQTLTLQTGYMEEWTIADWAVEWVLSKWHTANPTYGRAVKFDILAAIGCCNCLGEYTFILVFGSVESSCWSIKVGDIQSSVQYVINGKKMTFMLIQWTVPMILQIDAYTSIVCTEAFSFRTPQKWAE